MDTLSCSSAFLLVGDYGAAACMLLHRRSYYAHSGLVNSQWPFTPFLCHLLERKVENVGALFRLEMPVVVTIGFCFIIISSLVLSSIYVVLKKMLHSLHLMLSLYNSLVY